MEKEIVGYVPRLLFKVYLYLKDKFDPRPPVTREEEFSIEICNNLIENLDSKLTFSPKSLKRFIRNDEFDVFIVIHEKTINLINHVYSYSVFIESTELYNNLIEKFDSELEVRREELENEIKNNIQHSLQSILKKITQ